ncbi:sensor histidine kinase [Pseudoflavonifractor sp. 60]|uniref:sensor histidine kinase n=1 Tax=Pseudoflavonifractor sp. 60 TaxID=2304576 RepID=UPI001368D46B|nr:HAMP domain-containing sensor histidine kinase [Pseudoflavonifractor sp. 60]NBI67265.1 sensor histidine kinase [Pseudoflavonifractor sp. 60]
MKPVERFFRKYFLSMIGIIVLFLLLNIVLFFSVLIWAWQTSETPKLSLNEICDSIVMDEAGHFTTSKELAELLEEHHAWAMLLDDKGTVIFQERMPEELPRQYTPADVAKFSRWYLGDYPVYVQEHPQGLLVVGGEKGSQAKYYFSVNESYVKNLFTGLIAVFLANIIVVVLLIWKNIRHVEKAVTPILRGIETVSSGQPVSLTEKGELAEINRQLNKAGAFIVKKDSARADWISGISHDVRTPLSVILGFAGQLEDNQTLPAPAREQAACIRKQGEKLRNLISDLNLASRLEYSMQPLRLEKIYLVELARQVVCEFLDSGLEEQYRITFSSDQESEMASTMGDEALLKRALYNLIQNSMIHNSRGCDISVSAAWNGNHTVITVSDNGIGVSAEKLEELKANTHRIESTDERLNLRHGLGVLLVWQIVEAHHGTMEIFSEPQGGYKTVLTFSNDGI